MYFAQHNTGGPSSGSGGTGNGRIWEANLDGSGVPTILVAGLQRPRDVALDPGAGKIYWVDETTKKIQSVNVDGTGLTDVVAGLASPSSLALLFDAPPVASCVEGVNPSGKNIPRAGRTTKPGKKGPGQNEDGFYELRGEDEEDGAADVWVTNASGSAMFGPFASGSVVKLTEAPGATPSSKPMGGPKSAVAAHIRLDSDAFVIAVDSSGQQSAVVSCLVPPPPK